MLLLNTTPRLRELPAEADLMLKSFDNNLNYMIVVGFITLNTQLQSHQFHT